MIAPWVKKFVEVVSAAKLGVCEESCLVQSGYWHSGCSLAKKSTPSDRFMLTVPYAHELIEWHVIFNFDKPDLSPDFIFDCNDFEPSLDALPHLMNWDARDPHALFDVVLELYAEYKRYHVSRLKVYPRLNYEYTALVNSKCCQEDKMEVFSFYPDPKSQIPAVVFLIDLNIDQSTLPEHMCKEEERQEWALLKVVFKTPDSTRVSTQFLFSSGLHKIFGDQIRAPSLPAGSHLAEFVPRVRDLLNDKIASLDNGLKKRKAYVEALLVEFKGGVLEFDAIQYNCASFLIDYLDFNFILTVTIPNHFPKEQPKLTLSSVYHMNDKDGSFSKAIRSYPWSPRWHPEEMSERLRCFLQEIIPTFQRASVNQGVSLYPTNPSSEEEQLETV